jgi:hypothetical protein
VARTRTAHTHPSHNHSFLACGREIPYDTVPNDEHPFSSTVSAIWHFFGHYSCEILPLQLRIGEQMDSLAPSVGCVEEEGDEDDNDDDHEE